VIEVLDEGPGVPEHLLTDMFRPFFRVETARDRDAGGAGLGLSIAQRSIAVCGGSVSAKNYEKGLLVEVRLRIWS
jgi:two-component system sensor histidine kinase CpxA